MKSIRGSQLLIIFVAMITSVLVGCSSKDQTKETGGEGSNSNEVSGKLEIQYFVGGFGDEWWKTVIKDFETEYPGVEVIQHSGPNIDKEMMPRWIAGNPPDVLYLDSTDIGEADMVRDDQFLELTEWVNTTKMKNGSSIADNFIVPPNTYQNGEIYSIPIFLEMYGLWYDQAMFEKQGFSPPSNFPSWIDSMKEIKENMGIFPLTTTGQYPTYFLQGILYPAFASAGGNELLAKVIKGEEGAWTSDEVVGVMEKVQKIVDNDLIDPDFAGLNHTQSQMDFLLHKNAYIPVGLWLSNEMKADITSEHKLRQMPIPMNDEGDPKTIVPNKITIAIAKKAKNPIAAKAFLEFAFQEKYALEFALKSGALMNLKDIDLEEEPKVPGYLKEANNTLKSDIFLAEIPQAMDKNLSTPIQNLLVSFLLGKMDAKEFSQQAEAAAEEFRKRR